MLKFLVQNFKRMYLLILWPDLVNKFILVMMVATGIKLHAVNDL